MDSKREEKIMPPESPRPNVVLGTTYDPEIYDKVVACAKSLGVKDHDVVRIAVAQFVSKQ